MKKIANCLYSIRSSYTHSNIRSFIPSICWDGEILSHNTKYLIQNDMDLLEMLKSVILELYKELYLLKGDNKKRIQWLISMKNLRGQD